jgi:hypothetical protein
VLAAFAKLIMRMQSAMSIDDTGVLHVDNPIPVLVRAFGVPFLFFGLWFARMLFWSVADVVSGRAGWIEMLPGQLIASIMMLAFVLPGVAMCFARRGLSFDKKGRMAIETIRLAGLGRTRCIKLAGFERVRVAERIKHNRQSRDSVFYDVELVTPTSKIFYVASAVSAQPALLMGKRLAFYLDMPIEDHTVSDPIDDE